MAFARIRRLAKPALVSDACALSGAAAVVYGVYLLSVPAAWILGGLFLFTAGILSTLSRKGGG